METACAGGLLRRTPFLSYLHWKRRGLCVLRTRKKCLGEGEGMLGRFGIVTPRLFATARTLRVSQSFAPVGGERKSNPVFSGDMRLGKHSAQGGLGDNSEGIEPDSPCIPSQKSLDFCEKVHDGSDASSLSRLACSRRPASLRFGTQTGRLCRPWFVSLTSVHPGCSQRLGRF